MYPERRINKPLLLVISLVLLVFIGLAILPKIWNANYSATVTFITAPQNINVSYGEKSTTISAEDAVQLKPGSYTFSFTKEGFTPYETTVQVDESADIRVTAVLEPETDQATKEMLQDNNQEALQGVSDIRFTEKESRNTALPISEWLPFQNFLFAIDYHIDPAVPDGSKPIVTIDAVDGYRQSAVNQIESWGYNPADLKFEFTNHNNPFAL